jgi:hypothetical protein
MKLHHWVGSILIALAAASCTENNPPPTQSQTDLSAAKVTANPQAQPQVSSAQSPSHKPSAQSNIDDTPIPPVDAQWTIFCDSVSGVGHIENARILRSRLVALTGLHDWYVIHSDKESSLYYGYYRSLDDPSEHKRAEADRVKVASLSDRYGNHLIRGGLLQPITAPDPVAPAAWNLVNAPKNAYWTIEVATFSGNPKRKEAAVQAVRELRDAGETQAFYYHGPTVSSVCVGAWPREAVAEQGTGIDGKGLSRDDAHTGNADQALFVFGGFEQAPPNVAGRILEPGTNKPMAVEGKRLEILDQDMKQKTLKYPEHYVNYQLHATQNGNQSYPDPSVLVAIPHEDASSSDDNWRLTGGGPNVPPSGVDRPAPAGAGDSVLRSIGDR